jgi:phosphopantothenoylcysteine decarboxylase/phosphopantothenate--cysteine ligase
MKGKRIIVGVTGGIAAYKAVELVRLLVRAGAHTQVGMTRNATRFVTPLTFEALSGNRVVWDMWDRDGTSIDHITWGQQTDLIIIAPATANFIAKMALGIGDDFLSTCVLAATAKILVCPSMNTEMFRNPAVQANLRLLEDRGVSVLAPGQGALACHAEGPGRLPEPEEIVQQATALLTEQDLSSLRILVTAGPTVEPIDPVRYLSNRSTGKMGYAIAGAAARRGASVTLVSGPTALRPPSGITVHRVQTAEEMKKAVLKVRKDCDVIVKAAAVSDYRPETCATQKLKKKADSMRLELVKNPDILFHLGRTKSKRPCLLVGFAAETEDLMTHAEEKLKQKNLDMIVANDVSREDAGFEADTNVVKIISRGGMVENCPKMTKGEVADLILDRVKTLFEERIGRKGRS